jgi:hypothetical protein
MPSDVNTIQAWCAIISTMITLIASYFVVQTFTLQAKVMLEQSKITKLEVEKAIKEKNPMFSVHFEDLTPSRYLDQIASRDQHFINTASFKLERNDIYDLNIRVSFENNFLRENFSLGFPKSFEGGMIEGSQFDIVYTYPMGQEATINEAGGIRDRRFSVFLSYSDIIGTRYMQRVLLTVSKAPLASPPIKELFEY